MIRRALWVLAALVVAVFACACEEGGMPQLIQVTDVAPREVEEGDRLEVLGEGFPQGRRAKVTLRGTLYRPGEAPLTRSEVTVDGLVTSSQKIEVVFSDATQALFCGTGDRAAHTSFEGEVQVAFASATIGGSPVAGTLRRATLDFRPSSNRAADARVTEAERALAFAGMRVDPQPLANGGLIVLAVARGSRAEQAGILANDVITTFGHVRVTSVSDVTPPPGARDVAVVVRRASETAPKERTLRFDGFRAAPPVDLLGAAVVLAIATAIVILFFGPSGKARAWLDRRVAMRLRRREAFVPQAASSVIAALAYAVASLPFAAIPFAQYLVAADLDIAILYVVSLMSLLTATLITGGPRATERYSLVAALRGVLDVVSYAVPSAIAILCVVVMTGSVRVHEIIGAQGGWPWQWYAFKSPVTLGLCALYFTMALADGGATTLPALPEADAPPAPPPSAPRLRFFFIAERANVVLACGLAVALFLGGYALPTVGAAERESRWTLELAGAGLMLAKTWGLVALVLFARSVLPRATPGRAAIACWKYGVPLALAGLGLCVAHVAWSPGPAVETLVGSAMFVLCVLVAASFVAGVRFALTKPAAQGHANPFL